ncbi:AMP-dependent synthetase [Sulfolobales archaeon HS-7]|nr:AMP-dependent synthetase [Sulfolobales archaeon HS-7]
MNEEEKIDLRKFGNSFDEISSNFRWSFHDPVKVIDNNEGVALIDDDKEVQYSELRVKSNGVAKILQDLGVKKGDVVGVLLPQSPMLPIGILGVYKLGGVALSLSTLFGTDALTYRLKHSEAKVVITDDDGKRKLKDANVNIPVITEVNESTANFETFSPEPTTPTQLFYTSGTTGEPKGVLLPRSWILGHLPAWQIAYEFDGRKFITPSEWAWIGGLGDLLLSTLYYGRTVVVYSRKGRLDVMDLIHVIQKHKVDRAFLVPTVVRMLRGEEELSKAELPLRAVMSGGEPVTPDLVEWSMKRGFHLNQIYGQTEVNLVICSSISLGVYKPGYLGRPCPGHFVSIMENGNPSRSGEIVVKLPDPSAMIGYFKKPEETSSKMRNGWVFTGDIGELSNDGYISFLGRNDDIIKSSGYRISPIEVESVISSHPAVKTCSVVGVEDPLRGVIIAAFVVLKEGYDPSLELENSIKNHVKGKLAYYAYPRIVKFVDTLPTTVTGKIRRKELRELIRRELNESS